MRGKRARLIVMALILCTLICYPASSFAQPTDLGGHWAEALVAKAVEKGWVLGYADDTFRPDKYITRAEFVAIMNQAFGFTEKGEVPFADVPEGEWYRAGIGQALKAGYIAGYSDGTMQPNGYITRQEAATMVAKILNATETSANNLVENYSDAGEVASWSKGAVNFILSKGIMAGYPDNTFRATGFITRAEVVAMLIKTFDFTIIDSIEVQNGSIKISLLGNKSNLKLEDFSITAEFNGKNYRLPSLNFDPDKGIITFSYIYSSSAGELKVTVGGAEGSAVLGSASSSHTVEARRSSGGSGGGGGGSETNTAPTTPVISKIPNGNVSVDDMVTITASSTDAENDAITYVWTGRLAETSKYPAGRHVITVKAVDEHGLESQPAAIIFFSLDAVNGSGGMVLTGPESRIYENGIDGATITSYTFNVPPVSGHYGDDYGQVKGLNITNGQWEQLDYQTVSNGVYFSRALPAGTYSRLEFFYYTNHDCMYNKSNITYTVEFAFGNLPPGIPPESLPEASDVSITGTAVVGETLTGSYDYSDVNGDLEGTSLYQWYRADDAAGTNLAPIAGAIYDTYTLTVDDENKYIFFEVTPVALTGVTGTITGEVVTSLPVQVLEETPPVATTVSITGTAEVGRTLTGSYTYNDVNGDLEGSSLFKWYRADNAAGTNQAEISGEVTNSYTLTPDDEGKYIFFEVTPVALTGTLQGIPVISATTAAVATPAV